MPLVGPGVGSQVAVLAIDSAGEVRWHRAFPGGLTVSTGVATDSQDNVILVGHFAPDGDAGDDLGDWIVKLSPDGDVLWQKRVERSGSGQLLDVGTDDAGAVVVAGQFEGALAIGSATLESRGFGNAMLFVARLDVAGETLWARRLEGLYDAPIARLATRGDGSSVISGGFTGQLQEGGEPRTSGDDASHVFALRLDREGTPQWATSFGTPQFSHANAVALDASGRVSLGGVTQGMVTIGTDSHTTASVRDGFVATFGPSGEYESSMLTRSPGVAVVSALAYLPDGRLVIAGSFDCTLELPEGTLTGRRNAGFMWVGEPAGM